MQHQWVVVIKNRPIVIVCADSAKNALAAIGDTRDLELLFRLDAPVSPKNMN